MPTYAWSCLACGNANPAGTGVCAACACPAVVASRQIAQFRAGHLRSGGQVRPGAAIFREAGEWSAGQIFAYACLAVLGISSWLPSWWSRRNGEK